MTPEQRRAAALAEIDRLHEEQRRLDRAQRDVARAIAEQRDLLAALGAPRGFSPT